VLLCQRLLPAKDDAGAALLLVLLLVLLLFVEIQIKAIGAPPSICLALPEGKRNGNVNCRRTKERGLSKKKMAIFGFLIIECSYVCFWARHLHKLSISINEKALKCFIVREPA